jgi:beta-galactosidase GanA
MFKLHQKASPATEAIEYVTAGGTLAIGSLVGYSGGKVVANTTAPEYVTLGKASNGETVAVKRIYEDEIYETTLSAAGTGLNVGDKVTVTATQATATKTDGVFEIIAMDGTAIGSKVRGLFRR